MNCWPKIAFYALKRHLFILGFSRSSWKKGRRKAQKRHMTLIFWQKMPNSILLKVRKMNKLSWLLFELLKKRRDDGGIHPPPPNTERVNDLIFIWISWLAFNDLKRFVLIASQIQENKVCFICSCDKTSSYLYIFPYPIKVSLNSSVDTRQFWMYCTTTCWAIWYNSNYSISKYF